MGWDLHRPPSVKPIRGKAMFPCSNDPGHRLTRNQAKASGGVCTHCGHHLINWRDFAGYAMDKPPHGWKGKG